MIKGYLLWMILTYSGLVGGFRLNLVYLNNDEHTHIDRANGNTDILDMAFVSPNLAIHDIQFQIGDDLGSDHLPIEISIDTTPHRNTYTNHTKYKFDQTD